MLPRHALAHPARRAALVAMRLRPQMDALTAARLADMSELKDQEAEARSLGRALLDASRTSTRIS